MPFFRLTEGQKSTFRRVASKMRQHHELIENAAKFSAKMNYLINTLIDISKGGLDGEIPSDCAQGNTEFDKGGKKSEEDRPTWDSTTYCLRYRGVICLEGKRKAKAQDRILEAFEAAGWPGSIPSPFGTDEKKTRDTIPHLNERLTDGTSLRFKTGPGAKAIKWTPVDPPSNPSS
jgi:hypothetical protein